jgi:hypothetical protein
MGINLGGKRQKPGLLSRIDLHGDTLARLGISNRDALKGKVTRRRGLFGPERCGGNHHGCQHKGARLKAHDGATCVFLFCSSWPKTSMFSAPGRQFLPLDHGILTNIGHKATIFLTNKGIIQRRKRFFSYVFQRIKPPLTQFPEMAPAFPQLCHVLGAKCPCRQKACGTEAAGNPFRRHVTVQIL